MPELTDHARKRMQERGITEADIELALRREFQRSPGDPGTVWVHGMTSGGRILKVCISTGDDRKVITVAWQG